MSLGVGSRSSETERAVSSSTPLIRNNRRLHNIAADAVSFGHSGSPRNIPSNLQVEYR
jgi:hypothetical protein